MGEAILEEKGMYGYSVFCPGFFCEIKTPIKIKFYQLKKRESQDKENISNKDIVEDGTPTSVAL